MGEKIVIITGLIATILFLPYIITVLINGDGAENDIQSSGVMVNYEEAGEEKTCDLEQYMEGVLSAILPPDYEYGMYQAFAVILRTNARALEKQNGCIRGEDIDGMYLSESERENQLGKIRYEEQKKMIQRAITSTNGYVLTYHHNYIHALYHITSIGKTVSAKEVYGQNYPYLASVDSPQDVESKDYMQIKTLNYEDTVSCIENLIKNQIEQNENKSELTHSLEIQKNKIADTNIQGQENKIADTNIQGQKNKITDTNIQEQKNDMYMINTEADISSKLNITKENYMEQIKVSEQTENGYVKKVKIGNQEYTGQEVENAFKLNSICYYVEPFENSLRIVCLGKGHGLGLSMYGANQKMKQGESYQDVLTYYYKGAKIEKIN